MTVIDREHLKILAICHYILGGLFALCGCVPVIYLLVGVLIVGGDLGQPQPGNRPGAPPPPPESLGWMLIGIASVMMLFLWAHSVALVAAGRCLQCRQSRIFCMVVAGFSCLQQPLGLLLGIFTFIVLSRPKVRAAFDRNRFEPRAERYRFDRDEDREFDRYHHE
ncbi:hypothetical protein GobsT_08280 [Gemmata obscuriglobus]|uniref:Transmembrane protein n=1 Tax=Gemmata obscuriglobus TaxID=114 RepID=A0A2Z3HCE7_9BACT|nr:hypothetical protein [Gemmata obscuriglobus]AWM40645.1 hypothetical protein C1280_29120 [Gemmata obscuriglobus]QEG26093.1 hypothetical protein GobsT_08280 [Gemmata obscuriglobus]VTS00562.1 Membrane protein OS=Xanthomonas campestris pv. musacearum NCPPB 2005 GN=KWM_0119735 PE=4 SV=1 [Gemmata obscuriglobus UQM 2246]